MTKAVFDDGLGLGHEFDKGGPGLGDGRVVFNDNLVEFFVRFRKKHRKVTIDPPQGAGKWKVKNLVGGHATTSRVRPCGKRWRDATHPRRSAPTRTGTTPRRSSTGT
jgi:hypothetical protein